LLNVWHNKGLETSCISSLHETEVLESNLHPLNNNNSNNGNMRLFTKLKYYF